MSELYNGIQLNPTISNENEKYQLALGISKVGIWDYCAASNRIFFSKPSKSIIGLEDDPLLVIT